VRLGGVSSTGVYVHCRFGEIGELVDLWLGETQTAWQTQKN